MEILSVERIDAHAQNRRQNASTVSIDKSSNDTYLLN